ncbi:DUF1566 domain-containing protein [candidate division KSB1 bacterium]|nr:DUF1566 domain-containing protein [candidate division KSB1 bacterium]
MSKRRIKIPEPIVIPPQILESVKNKKEEDPLPEIKPEMPVPPTPVPTSQDVKAQPTPAKTEKIKLEQEIDFTEFEKPNKSVKWSRYRRVFLFSMIIITIALFILVSGKLVKRYWPENTRPELSILSGMIYHPDSTVILKVFNRPAKMKKDPIFVYDNLNLDLNSSMLHQLNRPGEEIYQLKLAALPDSYKKDGIHNLYFYFKPKDSSEVKKICLDSRSPQASGVIEQIAPNEYRLFGEVIEETAVDKPAIKATMNFKLDGQSIICPLILWGYSTRRNQKIYYFDNHIQNLPVLPRNTYFINPIMLTLEFEDAVGNKQSHDFPANIFREPREVTFGANDFEYLKSDVEGLKGQLQKRKNNFMPELTVSETSRDMNLQIIEKTPEFSKLSWLPPATDKKSEIREYFVFCQNWPVGVTLDTTFTDRTSHRDSTIKYQVYTHLQPGTYIASVALDFRPHDFIIAPDTMTQVEPIPVKRIFRATSIEISIDEVTAMLKAKNLFDVNANNSGTGFSNRFEQKNYRGATVVIDRAAGLMWQQTGSEEMLTYQNAQQWIQVLNQQNYAGFRTWRLPTLEEAMSLMEPGKKNGNLYNDPTFNQKQWWIWTTDQLKGETWPWIVYFSYGICGVDYTGGTSYVRAVRSL